MAKTKKIEVKAETEVETPLQPVNIEKEARRKMLLDLQATCDREHIHSLSDIEFKLVELDRQ